MSEITVAVMQPYFFPYAGYFRLFALADHFVIYDCVQFPRSGRVHRCQLPGAGGNTEWLTLPLARQPRDVKICNLEFHANARQYLDDRLRRYSWLEDTGSGFQKRLYSHLFAPLVSVIDFLEEGIGLVTEGLRLSATVTRSSSLDIDSDLKGQDRVIAIVKAVKGSRYINSPGGVGLYDKTVFRSAGIALRFLAPYRGEFQALLPALFTRDEQVIRGDIIEQSILVD